MLWLLSTSTYITCLLSRSQFTSHQGKTLISDHISFNYHHASSMIYRFPFKKSAISLSATPLIDISTTELGLPEDFQTECFVSDKDTDLDCLPIGMVTLPRHSDEKVSSLLEKTEKFLRFMHINSKEVERGLVMAAKERAHEHEVIHANNYVDLGKIDT